MKNKFSIITLAALATSGFASAASYTNYSSSLLTQATLLDFNVQKFDSTLGTLTGVTVVVTVGDLQGSPSVKNTTVGTVSISSITDTFFITTNDAIDGDVSPTLGYTTGSRARSTINTTPTMGSVSIAAGETQVLSINAGQSMLPAITPQAIAGAYFSNYQSSGGSGSVTFKAQNVFAITTTGDSYEVTSSDVGAQTQFAVTYTYTEAIPEPSAALLGGLGMLCLLRRRR